MGTPNDRRGFLRGIGALAALLLTGRAAGAQEPKAVSGRVAEQSRRVPPYFGGVGLNTEQRATIAAIREKHLARIEALQQQVEQEEHQMMAECEAVLTDEQRKLLEERRRTGLGGRPAVAPKAKEPSKAKAAGKGSGKAK